LKMALENRTITVLENGKNIKIAALSSKWVENRMFIDFLSPPPANTGIDLQEWKDSTNYFNADLDWLLNLPHHKFWSQIIYDKTIQTSLVSFLQDAPRLYSKEIELLKQTDCWGLYQATYNLVFLTFLRMATYKESKECYLSPGKFADLIYENFIFDVPKLMDLSALFGPTNPTLLSKMFHNIFINQPKYKYDLEQTADSLKQVLHLILGQLGLEDMQIAGRQFIGPYSTEELEDVLTYMVDIATTLWYFVDTASEAAPILMAGDFSTKLVEFYEKAVPCLTSHIAPVEPDCKIKMLEKLNLARKFLIQIYNALLHSVSIKPLLCENFNDKIDKENCVEQWLESLTFILSEHHFIIDYNKLYPLQDDIDLLTQMDLFVDTTRIDYIRNGLKGLLAEFGLSEGLPTPCAEVHSLSEYENQVVEDVTNIATTSLISQVKELLPDLDNNFVKACLKHYDYNAESVINAILEENLAPHLMELQLAPAINEVNESIKTLEIVEHTPKDISKKSRTKTVQFDEMRAVLDTDKQNLKSLVLERMDELLASGYEDEYDDTYDDHAVGCEEPDSSEFVVPRVLRSKADDDDDEEEEEDDVEQERTTKPRDEFVTDPALLREQAQQRWISRMSRRGHGRGPAAPQPRRDVVGAPRGQGQDKETVAARRHKAENKTRGANHNRRYMADRKRREF